MDMLKKKQQQSLQKTNRDVIHVGTTYSKLHSLAPSPEKICSYLSIVQGAIQVPVGTVAVGALLGSPHTRATQWTSSVGPALKRHPAKWRTPLT